MSGAARRMQRQQGQAAQADRRKPIPLRVLLLEFVVNKLLQERTLWRETLAKHGIQVPELEETTESGIVIPR